MVQTSGGNTPVEVGSLSHYLLFFYIPGGAGFLPSAEFHNVSLERPWKQPQKRLDSFLDGHVRGH